jgi:hypothetical protein
MLERRNFALLGAGISVSAPEVTVHLVKIRKGLTSDHQAGCHPLTKGAPGNEDDLLRASSSPLNRNYVAQLLSTGMLVGSLLAIIISFQLRNVVRRVIAV